MFNLISTDIAIFVYRGPWSRVYGIAVRGGDRYDGDPRMRDPWRNRHDLFLARRQLECVNLLELGMMNLPCISFTSISRAWISISFFLTWCSMSNLSEKVAQDRSWYSLTAAARPSLSRAPRSLISPIFSLTTSGTPMMIPKIELEVWRSGSTEDGLSHTPMYSALIPC